MSFISQDSLSNNKNHYLRNRPSISTLSLTKRSSNSNLNSNYSNSNNSNAYNAQYNHHHHSRSLESPTSTNFFESAKPPSTASSKPKISHKKSISSLFSSMSLGQTSPSSSSTNHSSLRSSPRSSSSSSSSCAHSPASSVANTRDNSISSITEMESKDMKRSHFVKRHGTNSNNNAGNNYYHYKQCSNTYGFKYQGDHSNHFEDVASGSKRSMQRRQILKKPIDELDIMNYDKIADTILDSISDNDVDWRI